MSEEVVVSSSSPLLWLELGPEPTRTTSDLAEELGLRGDPGCTWMRSFGEEEVLKD